MSICCKQYDASYTVEATANHTYREEILSYEREIEDPADTFRLISCGKDVLEEVFGK